jgi:2-iminobutanoate/2-iminopropanoate deaminase
VARQAVTSKRAPASPNYSQAVIAGDLVFVSGTVGQDMKTGRWPAGVEAQCEEALKNLAAILHEAGAGLDDVVKTTVWLIDASDGVRIAQTYANAFAAPPPARSAPVVQGFPIAEALISIEAIALRRNVPPSDGRADLDG